MRVREAVDSDLDSLLELLADLPVTTGEGERFEIDPARAREKWEQIRSQQGRTVLVAEADGRIVGTADLLVVPNLTHDTSPWAIVENVMVEETQPDQPSVCRALVDDALTRARAAGCYKVQLLSFKERKETHAMYRSLGFEDLAIGFRIYF